MNKDEAIYAMANDQKVTHRNFSPDEWMKLSGTLYEFEDGCLCEPYDFWLFRTGHSWFNGWEIKD